MNLISNSSLWTSPIYRQTVLITLGVLFVTGLVLFFFRQKNAHFKAAWASLQSWLFFAPVVFVILALPLQWKLISIALISISGCKTFFQMTGIYHLDNFVWLCYFGIFSLGLAVYYDRHDLYNLMPMIVLGTLSIVPILRNSAKHMLQYIGLTLMGFCFLGWAFMHVGYLLQLPGGTFLLVYIVILTEVCDNIVLGTSRFWGHIKPFSKINPRRTLEGFLISLVFTLTLAWGLRYMLPIPSPKYWVASGLIAAFAGGFGDLLLSIIRRDIGLKDTGGPFILGRGDLLDRMDRLIFVAPTYYYVMAHFLK